jgi:hypothetical protein
MSQDSKTDGSMYQVSFGSDDTVWVADFNGHRVHHFKQSGELIKTIGMGTAGISCVHASLPRAAAIRV